jgi:hypothetical protein
MGRRGMWRGRELISNSQLFWSSIILLVSGYRAEGGDEGRK